MLQWAQSQGYPCDEGICINAAEGGLPPNGPEAKAVPGMSGLVPMLLMVAIWRYYNGLEAKAVPGISGHARDRGHFGGLEMGAKPRLCPFFIYKQLHIDC